MNSTTNSLPIDLFGRGFLRSEELVMSDVPVSYSGRMLPAIEFITKHFQKDDLINRNVNNLWLGQIFANATGKQLSAGEMIGSLILGGFKYERNGAGAYFGITDASVIETDERYSIQYITRLPKTGLAFFGRKHFNSSDLKYKDSVLRDFLKNNGYPKPFVPSFLINQKDKMAIRFIVNGANRVIAAEAMEVGEAMQLLGASETKIETPEQQAF